MTINLQNKKGGRGIEWTDATWNPIAGCEHQCRWTMPDGDMAICYAEDIATSFATKAYPKGFDHHYWKPQHLTSPIKHKDSLKIFTGSMSDVFGARVPADHIKQVLDVIRSCPHHTFQMLTKNFPRVKQFDLPSNVWIGASMPPDFMFGRELNQTSKVRMLHRMLEGLTGIHATIRWMSFEPLSWDVSEIVKQYPVALDWAVIGAASKGKKLFPPSEHHFTALCDVLNFQEVPIFYKGNLKSLKRASMNWREDFPRDSFIADVQEMNDEHIATVQSRLI